MDFIFKKRTSKQNQQVTASSIRYLAGFPEVERPKFVETLRFPDDLTALPAQNISELHGKYTALFAYANQELAKLDMKLLRLRQQEALRRNVVFADSPGINNLDKFRREAVYESDPEIESIGQTRFRVECAKRATEAFKENYDKYLVALSRELTRKTAEYHNRYTG